MDRKKTTVLNKKSEVKHRQICTEKSNQKNSSSIMIIFLAFLTPLIDHK